mgnify:CR=1 FL=1
MGKQTRQAFCIILWLSFLPLVGQSVFSFTPPKYFSPSNLVSGPNSMSPQDTSFSTVAILPFDGSSMVQSELNVLTDHFGQELERTNAIQAIVNRTTVIEILDERGLADDFCFTDSCAAEIGNLLGVDFILRGNIINKNGWYTFEVNLMSVEKESIAEERRVYYNGDPHGIITEIELLAWNLVNRVSPRSLQDEKVIKKEEAEQIAIDQAEAARIAAAKRLREAKLGALWRSAVLPGWGQYFSGRKTSAKIWLGSELGAATLAILSYSQYSKAYDDFESVFDNYNAATDDDEIATLKVDAKKVLKEEHSANDRLKLFASIGGAVWIANMIHAYIAGPLPESPEDDVAGIDVVLSPELKSPQLRFYIALD